LLKIPGFGLFTDSTVGLVPSGVKRVLMNCE
jgi:hypothetical protein